MVVALLDPLTMSADDWPPNSAAVRTFTTSIARQGSREYIANVETRMMVLRVGDLALPVTVNDTEYDNSYVCSMTSYYAYMKDELEQVHAPALRNALRNAVNQACSLVRRARLNKIVQVNNWLVSTNPYPIAWQPDVKAITDLLTSKYPDHLICFRSVNGWDGGFLLNALSTHKYTIGIYRQVYVFDRLQESYLARNNAKEDRRMSRRLPHEKVDNSDLLDSDYQRMADLYQMLSCRKHSIYNPAMTADFMRMCHQGGLFRFFGLRNDQGILDGVAGLLCAGQARPMPSLLGYDVTLDRRLALYRVLNAMTFDLAIQEGWDVNLSSGVAEFKRNRGGRAVREYIAFYDRHLPAVRRISLGILTGAMNIVGGPLMRWLKL